SARAGFGVRRGRRPGATQEAWLGSVHDCEPREEGHRPVPGTTGVSAEVSLGVAEKTLPCRSTTQTYEVSSPGDPSLRDSALGPWRGAKALMVWGSPAGGISGQASFSRITVRRCTAYAFESRPAIGTSTKRGSP